MNRLILLTLPLLVFSSCISSEERDVRDNAECRRMGAISYQDMMQCKQAIFMRRQAASQSLMANGNSLLSSPATPPIMPAQTSRTACRPVGGVIVCNSF